MIGKLTDIGKLSGVYSPLLPLIYCDFYSCVNETDGVYVQTVDDEETLLFSLRNGAVNSVYLSDKWDKDEFLSFINFTHTSCVISDFRWDNNMSACCLMECNCYAQDENNTTVITPQSTLNEYRNIHSLLGDAEDDFDSWFTSFSGKVNSRRALAVYTEGFRSCAVCTAVMNNRGVIAGVYTDVGCRGKGYGRKAVQGLLSALCDMGISTALLWCEDKNIAFYEKLGFTCKGEIYYSEVV